MQKKIAIAAGVLIIYLILLSTFGPGINLILVVGILAYAIYRNNR